MMLLRVGGAGALAGLLIAVLVWQHDVRRQDRRNDMAAAQRELAATRLAPVGSAPHAGISARGTIDVPAFPDRLADRLHDDPDFHRLSHRCGVCHATPDPALHTAEEWPAVIERMSRTIDSAGLLSLSPADSAAALRALTKNYRR
jgi:hypothetical protein